MVRYERYVYDHDIITGILEMCDVVHVGFQDKNNAYVVPMNYGYEATDDKLLIFVHSSKEGYKLKLIENNPNVCLSFAAWKNFPDRPYKGHLHDSRSVMAFGKIRLVDFEKEPEYCKCALQALFKRTNRAGCQNPKGLKAVNMYVMECNWEDVSGKTETPVRKPEDVPFVDVYNVPEDSEPYDESDLYVTREDKIRNKNFLGFLDQRIKNE